MKWLARLNPLNWFGGSPVKRALTIEQFQSLGLLWGGSPAGAPVTVDTAMGVSAVFCADKVISEDIAGFPKLIYEGDDDDAKPLPNHPVRRLLARPNPEQTGPVFWAAFQHMANIWGFGLAEIARDGAGNPSQLWLIPSPTARLDRVGGHLVFEVPGPNGYARIDAHDVLFLPGFSPDGTVGYKLLHTARMTLGMAIAAQRFGAARFRNGLNPSGAIEHPGLLSDQARNNMRQSWQALYGGPDSAGVPMILEEGTKWNTFEIAHNDQLQLAELSEFLITEVSRFFNISPVKLHQLGRATWANLETLNREHVTSCLGTWLVKHEAEIAAKLLADGQSCRHVTDRLLKGDTGTRFEAWSKALAAGFMTSNEVRQREDLPPLPGGDVLLRPLNQGPASADPAPPTTEPPSDGTDPTQSA